MVLTEIPRDPLLDLDPWVAQRACTFKFYLTDAATGDRLGQITPLRDATLSHDTSRIVKRSLNLSLGTADTAAINVITDRVAVYMVFQNGATYPLGQYMFTAPLDKVFTSGKLSTQTLTDEMFIIDQPVKSGIGQGLLGVDATIRLALVSLSRIRYEIEASGYTSSESWSIGTGRGQILEALSVSGDYFSPWFDNNNILRFIRTFNPANKIADMDLDNGYRVLREGITQTSDLVTAPNTFMVIGNAATSGGSNQPIVATASVPSSAPHSVLNRGYEIIEQSQISVTDNGQAAAVARGLAQRRTVFEKVTLTTAPDPRHDSYNVIHWQGSNWLELSWNMSLIEGGTMTHVLRKAYKE